MNPLLVYILCTSVHVYISIFCSSLAFLRQFSIWVRILGELFGNYVFSQVGDSEQKLPEGISLYSIVSENYGKSSILGPLIKVSILLTVCVFYGWHCQQLYVILLPFHFSVGAC